MFLALDDIHILSEYHHQRLSLYSVIDVTAEPRRKVVVFVVAASTNRSMMTMLVMIMMIFRVVNINDGENVFVDLVPEIFLRFRPLKEEEACFWWWWTSMSSAVTTSVPSIFSSTADIKSNCFCCADLRIVSRNGRQILHAGSLQFL
jgi:hypothetical protein